MNLHNAICKRDNTSSGKIKFSININFLSGSIILASTERNARKFIEKIPKIVRRFFYHLLTYE